MKTSFENYMDNVPDAQIERGSREKDGCVRQVFKVHDKRNCRKCRRISELLRDVMEYGHAD